MSEQCKAVLLRRGVELRCTRWHREDERPTHECDGVYWGDDETEWTQCPATTDYCGEHLRCDDDDRGEPHRGGFHTTPSKRYGSISWNDEKRAQPTVMFCGLCMGHRYGSHEADSLMLAAATMQDAANRLEALRERVD